MNLDTPKKMVMKRIQEYTMPLDRKKFFLELAYKSAVQLSDDPHTQVGAVIVKPTIDGMGKFVSLGSNCLVDGISGKPERLERPAKYQYIEHAERNAVFAAAKFGHALKGCWMFCPWYTCTECARAIINSGITYVAGDKKMYDNCSDRWKDSLKFAFELFDEAGVTHEYLDIPDLNRHGVIIDSKKIT